MKKLLTKQGIEVLDTGKTLDGMRIVDLNGHFMFMDQNNEVFDIKKDYRKEAVGMIFGRYEDKFEEDEVDRFNRYNEMNYQLTY